MNRKDTTQNMVMTSLLMALICIATMIIKIPSPLRGYLNLGDCVVLLAGWMLSPVYGFLAAGLGSALADIFSGYIMYVPATFLVKGLMALIASYGFRLLHKKAGSLLSRIVSGMTAEIWMLIGYFIFEGILYGFAPAVLNIPANAVQGVAGLVLGCSLIRMFEKSNLKF